MVEVVWRMFMTMLIGVFAVFLGVNVMWMCILLLCYCCGRGDDVLLLVFESGNWCVVF